MNDWSKVKLTVEHIDTGREVHSTVSAARSATIIMNRMEVAFDTPQEAKRAHEAHTRGDDSPAAQQWASFEKALVKMQDGQAGIGIDHARLVRADFSEVERGFVWGRDTGWER